MPRNVIPIRGSEEEYARWKQAAELAGFKFSAWARRSLNDQADLDLAEQVDKEQKKVERELLRNTAFPGSKKSYSPDWRR